MNIHAIGWGILAMTAHAIWLYMIASKSRESAIWFWSILVGLAVTLITW